MHNFYKTEQNYLITRYTTELHVHKSKHNTGQLVIDLDLSVY